MHEILWRRTALQYEHYATRITEIENSMLMILRLYYALPKNEQIGACHNGRF